MRTLHRRVTQRIHIVPLLTACALISPLAQAGDAAPAVSPRSDATDVTSAPVCFSRGAWDGGWRVSENAQTLYIRQANRVYRLDLKSPVPLLHDPFAVLTDRGTLDAICRPIDFQLAASNRNGTEQWLIVTKVTLLSAKELASLPQKMRP